MFALSQVNWALLHLALTHPGVQSPCLCSPKKFWASPHSVFHFRAVQDHSFLSTLTDAHAEICTGSAFSGNSHKLMLGGTFPSETPMLTSEIGSYAPTPHAIPACVHFSNFPSPADFGCIYRNVALITSQSLWLSPCYSFSSFSPFLSFAIKPVCARRQLRGTSPLPS